MEIWKLKPDHFVAYLFLSIAFVMPGAGYIFMTNPQLFTDMDFFKLILLSIFYSLPIVLLSSFFTIYMYVLRNREPVDILFNISAISIFTLSIYYGVTVGFITSDNITSKAYLYLLYISSSVVFMGIPIVLIILDCLKKFRNK